MKIPSAAYKYFLVLGVCLVLTLVSYVWFLQTPYFDNFSSWSKDHFILLFIFLVGIKVTGIVWPPLPGGLVIFGTIPVIGWYNAFLADFLGNLIGCSIAYYLGKKWGYRFLNKLFDKETVEKIKNLKIKQNREIEAIIGLRILTGTLFAEILCYACGVLNIRYRNFVIGSLLSHGLLNFPLYFFAGNILQSQNFIFGIVGLALTALIVYKFRGRYLE